VKFVTKKVSGWNIPSIHAVAGTETAEKEVAGILREIAGIFKDVKRKVYKASDEAFREALVETGVPERAVPSAFRPTIVFTADTMLSSLAGGVEKGYLSDREIQDYMLEILDDASYDQGEVNMISYFIPVANPKSIERYLPEMRTSLREPSAILYNIKSAAERVVRNCGKLLGRRGEYFSCLSIELKKKLPWIRENAEKMDPEKIKDDLKEVYKAILEHGKRHGLGERFY